MISHLYELGGKESAYQASQNQCEGKTTKGESFIFYQADVDALFTNIFSDCQIQVFLFQESLEQLQCQGVLISLRRQVFF